MLDSLNASWLRAFGYGAVAVLLVVVGGRERRTLRTEPERPDLWPVFSFVTAALFAVMALGRAGDIGQFLADLGRQEAITDGWYEQRRRLQAMVVGGVGLLWLSVVAVALWKVPERRRRYLPNALVTFTIMCFAAVRIVSLHHIDAVLHRRQVAGAKLGPLVELALLGAAAVTILWHPWQNRTSVDARPHAMGTARRGGSDKGLGALDSPSS